jgi:hypothetical protein
VQGLVGGLHVALAVGDDQGEIRPGDDAGQRLVDALGHVPDRRVVEAAVVLLDEGARRHGEGLVAADLAWSHRRIASATGRPQAVAALANLVIRHQMPTGLHPVCDAGPIRHRDTSPLGRASAKALSCIGLRTFGDKIDYPRYPAEIQAMGAAKHSGPQGNSWTAMFARSGTVSSPGPWLC